MAIARKTKSEPVGSLAALDDTPEWREIYARLAAALGDKVAYSWLSHCRFIARTATTLSIAHWNGFSADYCVQHYGDLLARIARVSEVRIYRTGGYRPINLEGEGRKSNGFAQYHIGHKKAPAIYPRAG